MLYSLERSDYGDSRDVPSVRSSSTEDLQLSSAGGDSSDLQAASSANSALQFTRCPSPTCEKPRPPTAFNADDFFIMKASSECKFINYLVIVIWLKYINYILTT